MAVQLRILRSAEIAPGVASRRLTPHRLGGMLGDAYRQLRSRTQLRGTAVASLTASAAMTGHPEAAVAYDTGGPFPRERSGYRKTSFTFSPVFLTLAFF